MGPSENRGGITNVGFSNSIIVPPVRFAEPVV